MNKTNLMIAGLIVLIILLGGAIYLQENPSDVTLQEQIIPAIVPEPVKVPIVHYPVPEPAATPVTPIEQPQNSLKETAKLRLPAVLPDIGRSDASLQEVLKQFAADGSFLQLLVMDNFIPKLVVTIDNLPQKKLAQAHLPVKPPKGRFLVSGTSEAPQTSSRNHSRYEPYLKLLESLDPELVIRIYKHYYPLFQEAYKQLGYQNAYFNDRLIQVLDHLQETPSPAEPLLLSQPVVLYTYAEPSLEKLSSGQKILLRMGLKNKQRVLKVLAQYRQQLINQQ